MACLSNGEKFSMTRRQIGFAWESGEKEYQGRDDELMKMKMKVVLGLILKEIKEKESFQSASCIIKSGFQETDPWDIEDRLESGRLVDGNKKNEGWPRGGSGDGEIVSDVEQV